MAFFVRLLLLFGVCYGQSKPTSHPWDADITNLITMHIEHIVDGETKDLGAVKVAMFNKDLPLTTENFEWACENHFADSIFHRIIPQFMAQGGDFTNRNGTGGKSKFGPKFNDESFKYKHEGFGVASMANSGKNTNGSQFFLTFRSTPWLDGRHVVFGCITDGRDVMTTLEANGSSSGKPHGEFRIKSCSVSGAPKNTKCISSPNEDL